MLEVVRLVQLSECYVYKSTVHGATRIQIDVAVLVQLMILNWTKSILYFEKLRSNIYTFSDISAVPHRSRCGVVVSLRASERKVWSLKFYRNTAGICQEGHQEFKVLRCSSTKSVSKASS